MNPSIPELTICGYPSSISVAPGETVRFMVSEEGDAKQYNARLMRLYSADDNPAGPGLIEEEVPTPFNGQYPARRQLVHPGSCVEFKPEHWARDLSSFTVQAYLWPTTPGRRGVQTVLAHWDGHQGFCVELDQTGALTLVITRGSQSWRASTGVPLRSREWVLAVASFDANTGRMHVQQQPLIRWPVEDTAAEAEALGPVNSHCFPVCPLSIAARAMDPQGDLYTGFYNGKLDRVRLIEGVCSPSDTMELAGPAVPRSLAGRVLGFWDFACDTGTQRIADIGPWRRDGRTVHLPTRAMAGFNWSGEVHDFKQAPEQYGAIHFHDDDIYDAGWEADFAWTVPPDCPSGCYSVKLDDGNYPGYIVFFVRPPRGATSGSRPRIAFLAATATYQAYANFRVTERGSGSEAHRGRLWAFNPESILLHKRPEFGTSTYDPHSDGSGTCISSLLRPVLDLRPNSKLSGFSGDAYVLAFLHHFGLDVDVVTDHDLHREGAGVLEPYQLVMTGGHPEYHSRQMLDGLSAFLRRGGRMMYLGGNGFYWRVAFNDMLPGVMEIRRGEDGTRAWTPDAGEYFMGLTGEYSGLWRRNGITPNALVGVGFTAQGFDSGSFYRRKPGSHDPRAQFIFEGVDDEIIGDFGFVFGGAASQEIDRYDPALGSPPHALVLASSEGHTDNMILVNEEIGINSLRIGGTESPLVRADMVFFETGYGGAVFSTGSIGWMTSLACFGFDNNVAAITRNVVLRFIDAAPFTRFDCPDDTAAP